MRNMTALRILATASNIAFICYATLAVIHPVLLLHLLLLPMNVWCLWQVWRSCAAVRWPSVFLHRATRLTARPSTSWDQGRPNPIGTSWFP
ncbi:MAG: hypothetical protein H7Z19_05025 [Chitinophagaceae bacterium]|nr:hypothetical protein [Rubrivivax sp.]